MLPSLMTSFIQKTKRLLDFFQRYWWSKNLVICLAQRHNWPHPIDSGSLKFCLSFMIVSTQKNLRYWLIPPKYIDDQTILQSDWLRGTTGHTQPEVVILNDTFLWWLSPCKKSKRSLDSIQRYYGKKILKYCYLIGW